MNPSEYGSEVVLAHDSDLAVLANVSLVYCHGYSLNIGLHGHRLTMWCASHGARRTIGFSRSGC